MNDENLNKEKIVDNSDIENRDLNLDTPNEEKEEVILTINENINSVASTTTSEAIERGKVEIDLEEYVDFNELGNNVGDEEIITTSVPTSVESEVQIDRNKVDSVVVDIDKLDNSSDGDGDVSQEEHDENINSTTKLNEAGKKEVRIEVDETVTRVHAKDMKIKKLILAIFVAIGIGIIVLIRNAIIDSKYDVFIRDVKAAADLYMHDEANASYLYYLYDERIDEITISVADLKRRGFIDFELVNPKTKEDMSDSKVVVTLDGGTLVYTYPA